MSIIGQTGKFNLTDDFGKVTGEVTGSILDKVKGIRKVSNHLPQGNGKDGNYVNHLTVDFYLLKTENGIIKVEAVQYLGYPESENYGTQIIGVI